MNKKKVFGIFALAIISIIALSFLVGAESGGQKVANWISENIFQPFIIPGLGNLTANTQTFAKFLFAILVFLILAAIVPLIPLFHEKKGLAFLVAVIITILSVYFIPAELISPMLNPYTALGVAFISIIPFILMWLFTTNMITNTFLRKVAWMFFAAWLVAMSVYTYLGALSQNQPTWASYVYGATSLLALVMVFFEDWFEQHIFKGKLESGIEDAERRMQSRLALDRLKLKEAKAEGLPAPGT